MKDTHKEFEIKITASEFGNLAKFYKTYAKGNREILIEQIELEGSDEQHNCGLLIETIFCKPSQLKEKVQKFIDDNSLQQECFSVTIKGSKKVILTEDEL